MRHNSVAHATAMCRIYNSEDLDKVDYEGKRGKRRFPGREKFGNTVRNPKRANIFAKIVIWKVGSREPGPL